jgi:pimeloyl-ACP methyl ester carboxylesterase
MKAIWIGFALLLGAWGANGNAQSGNAAVFGDWRGTISAGETTLRAAFHLGETSTFDSPDQGVVGLPAQLSVAGRTVTVSITGVGVFEGTLSADGRTLEGVLKQGPAVIPISFERGIFSAANRPQTPVPPFPYRVEDVGYDNPSQAGVRLAGTLTLPKTGGPFPAVLLISGSGAQDRDESLFEHKPFLVLADALTRRGVAVLRVDDRGVGGSSSGPQDATTADYAEDVEAGLAWLRARKEIDPRRVGLLGHSEGALIASMVAANDPEVGFIVLWAGQGVTGKDVVVEQARSIALANGASDDAAKQIAELQHAILEAVIAAPNEPALRESLDTITSSRGMPPIDAGTISRLTSPWYRYFLSLDPGAALRNVSAPVLALLGSKDVQVTPEQNAPALRAALRSNPDASVEVLPGLNHLFQTAETGAPTEYGTIEETIAPAALSRVVQWIEEHAAELADVVDGATLSLPWWPSTRQICEATPGPIAEWQVQARNAPKFRVGFQAASAGLGATATGD